METEASLGTNWEQAISVSGKRTEGNQLQGCSPHTAVSREASSRALTATRGCSEISLSDRKKVQAL